MQSSVPLVRGVRGGGFVRGMIMSCIANVVKQCVQGLLGGAPLRLAQPDDDHAAAEQRPRSRRLQSHMNDQVRSCSKMYIHESKGPAAQCLVHYLVQLLVSQLTGPLREERQANPLASQSHNGFRSSIGEPRQCTLRLSMSCEPPQHQN